ncbi:Neprilysin-1 [Halotydeus destructor]|nr:Neprilysin-1 [Halotydeus destructor]
MLPGESRSNLIIEEPSKTERRTFKVTRKLLIAMWSSLAVLVLIAIICLVIASTSSKNEPICETEQCYQLSKQFADSMDKSADPCTDFYQFTCGNYLHNTDLAPTALVQSRFTESQARIDQTLKELLSPKISENLSSAEAKAAQFYQDCTDVQSRTNYDYTVIKNFLLRLGGWPLIGQQFQEAKYDPFAVIAKMNAYDIPGRLVAFTLTGKARKRTAIGVKSSFGDLQKDSPPSTVDAYRNLIVGIIKLISPDSVVNKKEIDDIIKFEKQVLSIQAQTITDTVPSFDFNRLFDIVFENAKTKYKPDTLVDLTVDFVFRLSDLIDKTPKRTVANYLGWQVANFAAKFSSVEMSENRFKFDNLTFQVQEQASLDDQCVKFFDTTFQYAAGSMYKRSKFGEKQDQDARDIIADLKLSFESLLEANNWMDKETKMAAKQKLDAMTYDIAMPAWLNDSSKLDAYYSGVNTIKGQFTQSYINYLEWSNLRMMNTFNVQLEEYNWERSPVLLNAFYVTTWNKMVLPVAMFNDPFYGTDRPAAVNYATLGFLVGHEITHGFDANGRLYDKQGNKVDWWSASSVSTYQDKKKCFIDQYDGYVFQDAKVDGEKTLSENIADNGGLREAYKAYQLHLGHQNKQQGLRLPSKMAAYSSKQIFYIAFANMWCSKMKPSYLPDVMQAPQSPDKFRVIGTIQNDEQFAELFKCPVKSKMSRENKCQIW